MKKLQISSLFILLISILCFSLEAYPTRTRLVCTSHRSIFNDLNDNAGVYIRQSIQERKIKAIQQLSFKSRKLKQFNKPYRGQ